MDHRRTVGLAGYWREAPRTDGQAESDHEAVDTERKIGYKPDEVTQFLNEMRQRVKASVVV